MITSFTVLLLGIGCSSGDAVLEAAEDKHTSLFATASLCQDEPLPHLQCLRAAAGEDFGQAQARAALEEGLADHPDHAGISWALGLVSVVEQDLPQAAEHFQRCAEAESGSLCSGRDCLQVCETASAELSTDIRMIFSVEEEQLLLDGLPVGRWPMLEGRRRSRGSLDRMSELSGGGILLQLPEDTSWQALQPLLRLLKRLPEVSIWLGTPESSELTGPLSLVPRRSTLPRIQEGEVVGASPSWVDIFLHEEEGRVLIEGTARFQPRLQFADGVSLEALSPELFPLSEGGEDAELELPDPAQDTKALGERLRPAYEQLLKTGEIPPSILSPAEYSPAFAVAGSSGCLVPPSSPQDYAGIAATLKSSLEGLGLESAAQLRMHLGEAREIPFKSLITLLSSAPAGMALDSFPDVAVPWVPESGLSVAPCGADIQTAADLKQRGQNWVDEGAPRDRLRYSMQGFGYDQDRMDRTVTRSGEPEVVGALAREMVNAVVTSQIRQLHHCYQKALIKKPDLQGEMNIRFVIERDGSVQETQIVSTKLADPDLNTCIEHRFKRFRFPSPPAGRVVVRYPLMLQPDKGLEGSAKSDR